MVMAANHKMKLALWISNSEWRDEWAPTTRATPLPSTIRVKITTAGPRRRSRRGGGPLRR